MSGTIFEGCIVHSSYESPDRGTRVYLVGRLVEGETFAVVLTDPRPGFYVRESEAEGLRKDGAPYSTGHTPRSTMDGERVLRLEFDGYHELQREAEALTARGVRLYESDIRVYDQILLERGIFGLLKIDGASRPGRHVDRVFVDPEIKPGEKVPSLSACSIDIENHPRTGEILSIALAHSGAPQEEPASEVLYSGAYDGPEWVVTLPDERTLLRRFNERIREIDPDVVTGWNVIEYDFRVISDRLEANGLPFEAGRSDRRAIYMPGTGSQSSAVIIPGRQVVDGMRVMRSSRTRFFDNKLETVAQAVLGEGKVELDGTTVEAIPRLHRQDPERFCAYNRRDARLVLDILRESQMLELTIRRAVLTGLPMSRAWTSVAAFENLYIARMHRHGLVAPAHGVDAYPVGRAPGGAIIPPKPGLYRNVLVFDFKSLYPSIMRTLNIDPVAYVDPTSLDAPDDVIEAPNGACFRRDLALLPDMLEQFFSRRAEAKAAGDEASSYAYKIIMNSFYGVLGTSGCRFAASDIAGAVTSFGHEFLSWCRRHFENAGHQVLYGDTDSLFVRLDHGSEDQDELVDTGNRLAAETTEHLSEFVERRWRVRSFLELEFECLYRRFFLPALRGVGSASAVREVEVAALQGRAKGYAGLRYNPGAEPPSREKIEIKGMEAVRRDWTDAAKRLQVELLERVFADRRPEELEAHIEAFIDDLRTGRLDDALVYHKALRKPVDSYSRSKPPHVKAALKLPAEERHGVVSYIQTTEGPEPVSAARASIDYDHYLERQLKPIVAGIGDVLGHDLSGPFSHGGQRELFG